MALWDKFFGGEKRAQKRDGRDRQLALSDRAPDRMKVAKNSHTQPELLYYLAQNDPDPGIRRAVAKNKATPVHASSVLAKDKDLDVRLALGNRLIKLLPNLSKDKQSQIYTFAIEALGTLALDEVLKVRIALSSALKDHAHAPPKVVAQLARDIEREVSEPILRFCMALADEDLLDILQTHTADWALLAVAGRSQISENISRALIARGDEPSGVALLENRGALISRETLGNIVEKSKMLRKWQKPIAIRKNLPKELARELAEFVDESVHQVLLDRTDYDSEFMDEISTLVKRRLDLMDETETEKISAEERVRRMMKDGTLNEDAISDALAIHDKDMVIVSLAALARTDRAMVEKIMSLNTPKSVIALCWKAGIGMRLCLRIQQEIALVPSQELIYPRGGTDYPMDEGEMKWQLEFLGV